MRSGFLTANVLTRFGNIPFVLGKLASWVRSLWNLVGWYQPTMKAQMPPELWPTIDQPSGSSTMSYLLVMTSGMISCSRKREYLSLGVSYCMLRTPESSGDVKLPSLVPG